MTYAPIVWKNHIVEKPRTYTMTENADGTITLSPAFGDVSQQGTPVSASNLNHMDKGISDAFLFISEVNRTLTSGLEKKTGSRWITLSFPAAGWAKTETGRYAQTVEAEDITEETRCHSIDINMSEATEDTAADIKKAWGKIDDAQTVDGGVMLVAFESAPKVDISVIIEVIA